MDLKEAILLHSMPLSWTTEIISHEMHHKQTMIHIHLQHHRDVTCYKMPRINGAVRINAIDLINGFSLMMQHFYFSFSTRVMV